MPTGTKGDYRVCYGKPPRQAGFKNGQSGSARGRPPGSKNLAERRSEPADEDHRERPAPQDHQTRGGDRAAREQDLQADEHEPAVRAFVTNRVSTTFPARQAHGP